MRQWRPRQDSKPAAKSLEGTWRVQCVPELHERLRSTTSRQVFRSPREPPAGPVAPTWVFFGGRRGVCPSTCSGPDLAYGRGEQGVVARLDMTARGEWQAVAARWRSAGPAAAGPRIEQGGACAPRAMSSSWGPGSTVRPLPRLGSDGDGRDCATAARVVCPSMPPLKGREFSLANHIGKPSASLRGGSAARVAVPVRRGSVGHSGRGGGGLCRRGIGRRRGSQ